MAVNEESIPVECEVRIDAPPEVIFKFFVDPDHMVRWKGVEATLDPRPGGLYRVKVTGTHVVRGEHLEVSPNERVVRGTRCHRVQARSRSRVVPDGASTIVRLRHHGLPGGPEDRHAEGWDHYLARLAVAAAGGDAGPDPWRDAAGDDQ